MAFVEFNKKSREYSDDTVGITKHGYIYLTKDLSLSIKDLGYEAFQLLVDDKNPYLIALKLQPFKPRHRLFKITYNRSNGAGMCCLKTYLSVMKIKITHSFHAEYKLEGDMMVIDLANYQQYFENPMIKKIRKVSLV